MKYQTILVATDLLDESIHVVEQAREIADNYNARLLIVSAVEPMPAYAHAYIEITNIENELVDTATASMAALGQKLNVPEPDQMVRVGFAKQVVMEVAKERNPDLIIVGSHKRRGLEHLIGSTAASLLHHAHCDVLTVFYEK